MLLVNLFKMNRLRRRDFGLIQVSLTILLTFNVVVLGYFFTKVFGDSPYNSILGGGLRLILSAFNFLLIALSIVASIRRFHDLNQSGWNTVLYLIPIVNIITLGRLGFVKGTKGPNKYGLDPKGNLKQPPLQDEQIS
jgi:uncharacterized membrane protein YhaH (DUF805 family)